MSAMDGVFQKGGFHYRTIPDAIALLPRGLQHAATVAMKCVLRLKARGKLDETATDAELARESGRMAEELAAEYGVDYEGVRGWSPSLVQKGLHALDVELRKLGIPLIGRESGLGMHGRRQITIRPLAGREKKPETADAPGAVGPPPAPPPEDRRDTTTDGGASSSSLASPPGGEEALPPDLAGAVGLLPDLSAERLRGWVALAGPELVGRVVAWLRAWRDHPRPECRPRGAFWCEKALLHWKEKIERGHLTMADVDAQIEAKARKWAPKAPPPAAGASASDPSEAAEKAREKRLRAAWGLLPDPEREAIRAAALAANPALRKLGPKFLEVACLEELERRLDPVEPHPRE